LRSCPQPSRCSPCSSSRPPCVPELDGVSCANGAKSKAEPGVIVGVGFEEAFRSVGVGLARFLGFAANGFLLGMVPVILLVVRPSLVFLPAEWTSVRARLATRMEELMQAAVTIAALATGLALLLQTLLVAGASGQSETDAFGSVVDSSFGRWHLVRLPLLLGLVVLLARRVRNWSLSGTFEGEVSPGWGFWVVWTAMAGALVATISLSGHSASGDLVAVSLTNDLVHVAAGATWFTGIVVLSVVLPYACRGLPDGERLRLLAPAVVRFSTVALVSITAVGITGAINSLLRVGRLQDLVDSRYGNVLALKIGLFLVILAVGGLNHFVIRHRLEAAIGRRRASSSRALFRRTIVTELIVAVAVLGLTGILTSMAPTRQAASERGGGSSISSYRG
jgi:copper transport protein